jgi:predicted PurR-regulated permease PerM
VGLFFGPIVLSVAWALVEAWVKEAAATKPAPSNEADSANPKA